MDAAPAKWLYKQKLVLASATDAVIATQKANAATNKPNKQAANQYIALLCWSQSLCPTVLMLTCQVATKRKISRPARANSHCNLVLLSCHRHAKMNVKDSSCHV